MEDCDLVLSVPRVAQACIVEDCDLVLSVPRVARYRLSQRLFQRFEGERALWSQQGKLGACPVSQTVVVYHKHLLCFTNTCYV